MNNYFRKYTENLAYLNLKDTSSNELLKDLDLPVYIDDMKTGIMTGQMQEEISLEKFLDGMIINIGVDPDFIHADEYKVILNKYIPDIARYTSSKALASDNSDKSLLFLRGGYILNPEDNYNSYLYARYLWPIAFNLEEENADEFVKEGLKILQDIISRDHNFAIAYYELGNIYKNLGEYIKARSYYNNALQKTDSPEAMDEIRDKLTEINDNAEIEEALYFIGKSRYDDAIKKLTGLLSNKKRADAYYYLGVAYQNIGQYDNSIMAFENSLDAGADFREVYNDYGVSLYLREKPYEALNIIEEGLDKYPSDPRISYNKIQINLVIGNINKAKEDIEELLTFDDLSDEIRHNLMIIKNQFEI
ncbi:tetratricopeptide repeat protein [Anaerococcus urinomassiliensis]|uniref:tetratricopeptide repeat protein n=1 Tax=Anaerococcus urinomassiliensis TaxID=1745712 RepID=UPI00093D1FB4|nr:tetratricopeptide repeat protein [Anaerococcus urinomassiliensis]